MLVNHYTAIKQVPSGGLCGVNYEKRESAFFQNHTNGIMSCRGSWIHRLPDSERC